MSFAQWEDMPMAERRHRIWLWLMDQQIQREAAQKHDQASWDAELMRDARQLAAQT